VGNMTGVSCNNPNRDEELPHYIVRKKSISLDLSHLAWPFSSEKVKENAVNYRYRSAKLDITLDGSYRCQKRQPNA
jgi:hypothetical protein